LATVLVLALVVGACGGAATPPPQVFDKTTTPDGAEAVITTTSSTLPTAKVTYLGQACPFNPESANGLKIECGQLIAPMRRDVPTTKQVSLSVAVIHSSSPTPLPDPVIYLAGGPGGSAVAGVDQWTFPPTPILENRDLILIDHSIQVLLEQYALEHGEDAAWLGSVFRGVPGQLRPIIRHAPGHATHIHVRFFNPIAQETARRCHAQLIEAKLTSAPQSFVSHKVKKNETLGMIARKYGVSVPRLRAANGLKSSLIREKRVLRVPVATKGAVRLPERARIPQRRMPPSRRAVASSVQPPPTK
jgi:LysM repeat protein